MRLAKRSASYAVVYILLMVLFVYFLLTYTRRVEGVSMYPTLQQGDLVVIEPSPPVSDLQVNDIIVYSPPCANPLLSELVIHRIVGTQNGGYLTKGDDSRTNPETDQQLGIALGPVYQNCIVGKVIFVVPYIELLASLPDDLNYVLALAILLVVVFLEFRPKPGKPADQ